MRSDETTISKSSKTGVSLEVNRYVRQDYLFITKLIDMLNHRRFLSI